MTKRKLPPGIAPRGNRWRIDTFYKGHRLRKYSTIPLDKRALEILRSIPRRFDSPYVFTGKIKGQPYWDLKRQFEEAVKAAKLEGVTFHTLRHTAAAYSGQFGHRFR
jgi:integrase